MMDINQPNASPRERERERSRRGDRGTRFSDVDNNRDRSRERRDGTRIYVSNVPYEYRWQDLKDLFRREVGDVEFVELFMDEQSKPRGCGIVEFKSPDSVDKALEKMNKHDLNGRQLVVKEDYGNERDKYGRVIRNQNSGGQNNQNNNQRRGGNNNSGGGGGGGGQQGLDRDDDRLYVYFFKTSFLFCLLFNLFLFLKKIFRFFPPKISLSFFNIHR